MNSHLRLAWSERIAREQYEADNADLLRDEGEVPGSVSKDAGASWRPRSMDDWWKSADIVIGSDSGNRRPARSTWEIYAEGFIVATRPTLREAQEWVVAEYGPVRFRRVKQEPVTVMHPYYGPTTEFTDPKFIYQADFLQQAG